MSGQHRKRVECPRCGRLVRTRQFQGAPLMLFAHRRYNGCGNTALPARRSA